MKKMMKKAEMGMQAKPKVTAKKMVPATKKKSYPILPDEGDNYSETMKREKELKAKGMMKMGGKVKKAKAGFDLNNDGKTTFKDVLIGRGVLPKTAKSGASMKKCKYGCK